jgi:hypothetical protein
MGETEGRSKEKRLIVFRFRMDGCPHRLDHQGTTSLLDSRLFPDIAREFARGAAPGNL